MKTDIQIAQEAELLPIREVAEKLDITEDELELYGKYKACLLYTSIPQNYVELTDETAIKNLNRILDLLDEDDDVQAVYHNYDE